MNSTRPVRLALVQPPHPAQPSVPCVVALPVQPLGPEASLAPRAAALPVPSLSPEALQDQYAALPVEPQAHAVSSPAEHKEQQNLLQF